MSGLRLTPEVLAGSYRFLLMTQPFDKWGLPDTGDVKFKVIRNRRHCGDHGFINGHHEIRVSASLIGHTTNLIQTMAHEMVHIRCMEMGDKSDHGEMFQRYARIVCRYHGFDPKLF